MTSQSKIHHYVPQHLLRNFSKPEDDQIFCFDKSTEKSFSSNPKNICAENGFNTFKSGGKSTNFEEGVSIYERKYIPALTKLLETEDLNSLSQEDRYNISLFAAFQKLRTKAMRETYLDLAENIAAHTKLIFPEKPHHADELIPSSEEIKLLGLQSVFENVQGFTNMLHNRDVFLLEAPDLNSFIIGDNPVALHNDEDFGAYGNLGWGLKGIQIYIPLTPKLTLCFWCTTVLNKSFNIISRAIAEDCIAKNIDLSIKNIEDVTNNVINEDLKKILRETQSFGEKIRTKRRVKASSRHVDFCNHLQVLWASRYLISQNNNFEIASKMINDNQNYRSSLKPKFN